MKTVDLIKDLVSLPAVSGSEDKLVEYLVNALAPYGEARTDLMNNVLCSFGEGYHILLDAHIDEIGMVVTSITDDGFLKAAAVGGIDRRMLLASEVTVWGKKELNGIISTLPPHLQKADDERKVPEMSEIAIDLGMSSEEVLRLVSPGDKITFKRRFTQLMNNRISSNSLDDRAGIASILLALDELKKLPVKITVLFSSQEEVGTRGAKTGAYSKNVDESISVDVSFGYSPDCSKEECGIVSKGAMIGCSPTLDRDIYDLLKAAAEKYDIPYQCEIMNGRTGTNADVISVAGNGIKCGLISIPLKYMHSPVEVVDISDVENVSRLIVAYAKEKAGAFNA